MIKNITTILIAVLMGCSNQAIKQTKSECKTIHNMKLSIETLKKDLIGEWNYNYSYKNDTCFQISKLGDLSRTFEFQTTNIDLIQTNYPKMYSFAKDKLLFGLLSYHEDKPFGNNSSYPLLNTISRDRTFVRITHYLGVDGVAKNYSYFIESVSNDTLILFNERNYHIGTNRISGIRHVYLKNSKKH